VTNCPVGSVTLTTYPVITTGFVSTSTIYSTKSYTITSCAPTVSKCPVGSVTSTVYQVSTTPVIVATPPPAPGLTTIPSAPAGTGTGAVVATGTTAGTLQVTAAAGRLAGGFEMAAGVAGAVVVAFL
jgi:hypothetical protein